MQLGPVSEKAFTRAALYIQSAESTPYSGQPHSEYLEKIASEKDDLRLVDVDFFSDESFSHSAEVTREVVEDGSAIVDHIAKNPVRVEMRGSMNALTSLPHTGRDKWKELKELVGSENLFTIVTHYGVYEDMAMTSIQTRVETRGLNFVASFEQVRLAEKIKSKEYNGEIQTLSTSTRQSTQEITGDYGDDGLNSTFLYKDAHNGVTSEEVQIHNEGQYKKFKNRLDNAQDCEEMNDLKEKIGSDEFVLWQGPNYSEEDIKTLGNNMEKELNEKFSTLGCEVREPSPATEELTRTAATSDDGFILPPEKEEPDVQNEVSEQEAEETKAAEDAEGKEDPVGDLSGDVVPWEHKAIGGSAWIEQAAGTKDFTLGEFECQGPYPGSLSNGSCDCNKEDSPQLQQLSGELVKRLQRMRDMMGEPLIIQSGYRCESHNAAVAREYNGSPSSKHKLGTAADVSGTGKWSGPENLENVKQFAIWAELSPYIGKNYRSHVHVALP